MVLIFSALLIAPLTVPGVKSRLMNAVLTPRRVRFVGRISYGVYLWHMVVVAWLLEEGNSNHRPPSQGFLRGVAFLLGELVCWSEELACWKGRLAGACHAGGPAHGVCRASGVGGWWGG